MRWGLWPVWVKDPRTFTLLINARAESIKEKPAFKNAIRRRRCLIPADGYYEWHVSDGSKRPYFIHRRDGRPIGFAAVSETWIGPSGEEVDTVAIVTAAANADLAVLHHRVPVTIDPEDFEFWLDCRTDEADSVTPLMRGPEEGEFVWHEISTRVNHVANDDAQLTLPITAEEREAEQVTRAKKPSQRKSAADVDDGQGSLF
jgi:putative SOS response-associated peptidase YedK